jgi:hypothetical protein
MPLILSSETSEAGEIPSGPLEAVEELDHVFLPTRWLSVAVPDGMNLLRMLAGAVVS